MQVEVYNNRKKEKREKRKIDAVGWDVVSLRKLPLWAATLADPARSAGGSCTTGRVRNE